MNNDVLLNNLVTYAKNILANSIIIKVVLAIILYIPVTYVIGYSVLYGLFFGGNDNSMLDLAISYVPFARQLCIIIGVFIILLASLIIVGFLLFRRTRDKFLRFGIVIFFLLVVFIISIIFISTEIRIINYLKILGLLLLTASTCLVFYVTGYVGKNYIRAINSFLLSLSFILVFYFITSLNKNTYYIIMYSVLLICFIALTFIKHKRKCFDEKRLMIYIIINISILLVNLYFKKLLNFNVIIFIIGVFLSVVIPFVIYKFKCKYRKQNNPVGVDNQNSVNEQVDKEDVICEEANKKVRSREEGTSEEVEEDILTHILRQSFIFIVTSFVLLSITTWISYTTGNYFGMMFSDFVTKNTNEKIIIGEEVYPCKLVAMSDKFYYLSTNDRKLIILKPQENTKIIDFKERFTK